MKRILGMLLTIAMLLGACALAEAGDTGAGIYLGRWVCDRAVIDIADQDGAYAVNITWGNSASEQTEWTYICEYDAGAHRLITTQPGAMAVVTYGEDGGILNTEVVSEDCAAAFTLEEDGMLVWDDQAEHIADGMRFEADAAPYDAGDGVIYPMYEAIDLEEGTYAVTFDRAKVADGAIADVDFYTVDGYDIVDISMLKAGDTLYIDGGLLEVESVGEDAHGDKLINGGLDEGGYTLRAYDEDNCWKSVGDGDFNSYSLRETATLKLSGDVRFTDGWDIGKDPVTVNGIDAVTRAIAESENEYFDNFNTEIRLEDGEIVEIVRYYVP